jgi:tetratricopeptide (TPR) repeat protein
VALAPPKLGDWGLVGRANDLTRLHEHLVNQGSGAVVPVSGLGGIGKTALALGYLVEYGPTYKLIAWIEAERPELIPSQYRALVMNYKGQELSEEDAVHAVKAIFAETDGWLMVFDNATTPEALASYLPAGNGRTLVTTRNQSWSPNQTVLVQIDKLPHQEVVGWMAEALPGSQASDLEGIASRLDGLPLAIVQALAYISARPGETAASYLSKLKTKEGRYDLLKAKQPPNYPQPVATTWDIATDFLAEQVPMALELLRYLAYMDPNALPIDLLDGLLPGQDLPGLLEALSNLGMIRSSSTQVSLHRLVQDVTRWPLGPDQEATYLKTWASHLNNVAPDPRDHQHIPWFVDLAPQLLSLADHLEALDLNPPEFGEVANSCGISLRIGAALQTALTILERALRIFEVAYGADHPHVAITLTNLGIVHRELGHHQRAVELYERALRIDEAVYGPDHPGVASTLTNLGVVHRVLGHHQSAVELYERALRIDEAAYGPDHPDTVMARRNLAGAKPRRPGAGLRRRARS